MQKYLKPLIFGTLHYVETQSSMNFVGIVCNKPTTSGDIWYAFFPLISVINASVAREEQHSQRSMVTLQELSSSCRVTVAQVRKSLDIEATILDMKMCNKENHC